MIPLGLVVRCAERDLEILKAYAKAIYCTIHKGYDCRHDCESYMTSNGCSQWREHIQ